MEISSYLGEFLGTLQAYVLEAVINQRYEDGLVVDKVYIRDHVQTTQEFWDTLSDLIMMNNDLRRTRFIYGHTHNVHTLLPNIVRE